MNAAIYARVSTAGQAEHGYSLATQIEACKRKAHEIGIENTVNYIDDGYSGAYMERPALDKLRDALAVGAHDTVIVYDTDRLARNVMSLLILTEEIEQHAQLIYVNSEYSNNPESKLFYQIKGSIAEYERIKIQDRTLRGKRGKLQKGLPIQDAHIFGYTFVDGQYVINDTQAEVVRLIFDLYANTTHSIPTITKLLNERGYVSQKGKQWLQDGVHRILRREHYTGSYYSNKTITKKTGQGTILRKQRDKSEWIKMSIPAIIDKKTFDAVQDKLTRNRVLKVRQTKDDYLLQGILFCGHCGKKIVLHHWKCGKYEYDMYKCVTAVRNHSCGSRYMRAETTDNIVWSAIKEICYDENTLKDYIKQDTDDNTPEIAKKLQKISEKRDTILSWFDNGLISEKKATEKLSTLKKQEENLKSQLTSQKNVINAAEIVKQIKKSTDQPCDRRNVLLKIVKRIEIERIGTERKTHQLRFHIFFR